MTEPCTKKTKLNGIDLLAKSIVEQMEDIVWIAQFKDVNEYNNEVACRKSAAFRTEKKAIEYLLDQIPINFTILSLYTNTQVKGYPRTKLTELKSLITDNLINYGYCKLSEGRYEECKSWKQVGCSQWYLLFRLTKYQIT